MSGWNTLRHLLISCMLLLTLTSGKAQQIDCDAAARFTSTIEKRCAGINTQDPEVITLHYLFVLDMLDSVKKFQEEALPNLHFCPAIDFFATLHQCNALETHLLSLKDTLSVQRRRVDTLFYLLAVDALNFSDTSVAEYYLDRALQFRRTQGNALILRMQLHFDQGEYDECLPILRTLYNEIELSREQEQFLADFNAAFYAKLYERGDSLVKAGLQADALPLFETLETFCHDLPSQYCNDDYYHGIIRSKSGVYESYLTISKVAWDRGKTELAYKFLDYAQEYRMANEDEVQIPEKYVRYIEQMEARRGQYHFNP